MNINLAIINLALQNTKIQSLDMRLTEESRLRAAAAYEAIECWFVRLDGTVFVPTTISPEAKRLLATWAKVS